MGILPMGITTILVVVRLESHWCAECFQPTTTSSQASICAIEYWPTDRRESKDLTLFYMRQPDEMVRLRDIEALCFDNTRGPLPLTMTPWKYKGNLQHLRQGEGIRKGQII
jgi:hypothetical protein